jgi:hypothetical protein
MSRQQGASPVRKPRHLACSGVPAEDPARYVSSSPAEQKLFGLSHDDAVANTFREGQIQERAGQVPHNAFRASLADDLLPGQAKEIPASAGGTCPCITSGQMPFCAPSRIRTCDLLLRSSSAAPVQPARCQVSGHVGVPMSDRDSPLFPPRSGTQRARRGDVHR